MKIPAAFFRNLRINQKLFISYLAVIMIPLAVLGTYSYYQSKALLVTQAESVLNDNINKIAEGLNYKLDRYKAAMESVAYNPSMVWIFNRGYHDYYTLYTDLKDKVEPMINTILFLNSDISQFTVYTGNEITERRNSILSLSRVENTDWAKEAFGESHTLWYEAEGKVFGVLNMVGDYPDPVRNLIYLEVPEDRLFEGLNDAKWKNYGIVVFGPNKKVVYSGEHFEDVRPNVRASILRTPEGGRFKVDGIEYMVIDKKVPVSGWTVRYYTPVSSIAVNAGRILTATFIMEAICLTVLLFVIWGLSVSFVKRIRRLNQKMKTVEHGNWNIVVQSDSRDEIGELTNRFGQMLKSMNALVDEVYRNNIVLKEAELRALQSQINPHFLYNSLSVINWKAIQIGAQEISHIVTTLTQYYRTTLSKGKEVITIREELENTRAYMDIQLIRHNYHFEMVWDIDERVYAYRIIKLVLQPIVENAVEHGIDLKREGRGWIRLSAEEAADSIILTVEDNGPGMSQTEIADVIEKRVKGYGLQNVQERLQILYGDEYGIRIDGSSRGGTRVTVRIPKIPDLPTAPDLLR